MPSVYLIQCFNCLSDFDAADAIWCSCNPQRPTKVCPFCMGCFCAAGPEFKDAFWRHAPAGLHEELETLSQSRMLIGEMLVRSGLITTGQLLEALNRQKTDGRKLGEILVDSGALPPDRIERFLKSQHTAVVVDLARVRVDAMMLRRLGVDQCLRDRILPLEAEVFHDRHIMTLAMADPSNGEAVQRVMDATGYQVIPGVLPADTIASVIRSIFPQGSATAPPSSDPDSPGAAPVGLAQAILRLAVRRRASHIQIQAMQGSLKLFLRVDGTLYLDRARAPHDVAAALEAFKALAGLEGDTRTVPRVARAEVNADGKRHVVMVRTRPGREGEEMSVKRIDPGTFPPALDTLGFPETVRAAFGQALGSEAGLLLVTSPPFSGASSTLHALAREAQAIRPTALVESPRGVDCPGALQVEFFPEIRGSLDAALDRAASSGARAIVVAATEGVVWNAPHTDLPVRMLLVARAEGITLPEALLRLTRAGYPSAALASRPTWVVHQRLLRRICPACRMPAGNAEEHASALGLTGAEAGRMMLWRGAGCDLCAATPGFNGRVPLAHALVPDVDVARALEEGSPADVRDACRAAGLVPMRREALAALAAGLTTVEEVTRRRMG
jgi:type II secretory ATPase GspE/PulE/Tfp pilus assembly ATPase PilB-like protein